MYGPDWSMPAMLAYMGLGSGVELIPYFLALISFVGAALVAVIQRPVILLIRWLRKDKAAPVDGAVSAEPTHESAGGPT